MKKVLLLALMFSASTTFGQSIVDAVDNDNLLVTPKQIDEIKTTNSTNKGGAVADYFSYYDLAIQWADQSNYSNFVAPMMPDTTTTLYWYDGTQLSLKDYGVTGVGALYDFSLDYWDNGFADGDEVTVDSIFIAGFYAVNDPNQSDTLRFHIFKADTNAANSGLYGGVYFPGGTFSNFTNDIGIWTMDYNGSSSQGNAGNIDVPNTTIVDYIFDVNDSAYSVHGIEIPNGFTLDADETFGFYVEFIPGAYGFNDTINLNTLDGTTNFFSAYFASDQSNPLTGEFMTYSGETQMCANLYSYAETRYGMFSGNASFLNDYLYPSSRRMTYFSVYASGNSSVSVEELVKSGYAIYPNPSNGVVNVELNANANATVTVVDILGQVVYRSNENFVAGNRKTIDLSTQPKGMYLLSVEGEGINVVERISIK